MTNVLVTLHFDREDTKECTTHFLDVLAHGTATWHREIRFFHDSCESTFIVPEDRAESFCAVIDAIQVCIAEVLP
jgi:hypothetical protein